MCVVVVFFFQAEDGIRDLVRSRGLGDVYKRQGIYDRLSTTYFFFEDMNIFQFKRIRCLVAPLLCPPGRGFQAVSYTHLTLPTSDLV